jgi:serine/threonine protein kinase/tetratricopeptide (TPR) repeat protein
MLERSMSEVTPKQRLDALVFRYLEQVEAGGEPGVVLEALCAEAPDDAEGLRRGVSLLRTSRLHPGPGEDGLPEHVGPFALLRRLGSGGMGVVYLARQRSPERLVALKLVRPDQLWFDGSRERFAREVASTARLSHPGIAPMYEAGDHDGVPWFSQEFVAGASLDRVLKAMPTRDPASLTGAHLRAALADALRDDPPPGMEAYDEAFFAGSWSDVCLAVVSQVAAALSHAHERGVLHRDVKPGNIMLTPSGRAVLVDFGLAHLGGVDGLTRSGAQLGSLPYMSPEQLDGRLDEVGPASDVYALGVTLYELLTLRLPYSSASIERVRGLILDGAVPSPRKANATVPADVAAVCLHAMDREASRRYPGAGAFAADLGRALRREPVTARPAGPVTRAARWCRRRPAAAAAVVLGVLAFGVAPIVVAVERSRAAAETEAHFDAALDAVEYVLRQVAGGDLEDIPGMAPLRLTILDQALRIFGELAASRPDDARVAAELALLQSNRADVLELLGDEEAAAEAFGLAEQAFAAREAASSAAGAPEDAARHGVLLQERGAASLRQAALLFSQGQAAEAEALYRDGLEHLQRAAAQDPSHSGRRSDILRGLIGLGRARADQGDLDQALALAEQVIVDGEELLALVLSGAAGETLGEAEARQQLAYAHDLRRQVFAERGDPGRAAVAAEQALEAMEAVLALQPGTLGTRLDHGRFLAEAGRCASLLGELDLARQRLERSKTLMDALAAEEPGLPSVRDTRLATLMSLVHVAGRQQDGERAVALGEEVARLSEDALALHPDDLDLRQKAAAAWFNLSVRVHDHEDLGEARFGRALECASRSLDLLPPLLAAERGLVGDKQLLFGVCLVQSICRSRLDDLDGSLAALAVLDQIGRPQVSETYRRAEARAVWTECAADTGRDVERARLTDEAVALLEQAMALGFADRAKLEAGNVWSALGHDPRIVALRDRLPNEPAQP